MQAALRPDTLHPTLSLSLSPSLFSTSAAAQCQASVLVHLPPSLFFDPYTSYALQRDPLVSSSRLLGPLELERPVGWSLDDESAASKSRSGGASWPASSGFIDEDDEEGLQAMVQGMLRKAVGETGLPLAGRRKKTEDLEQEHTTVALALNGNNVAASEKRATVEVPLHVRYMPPRTARQKVEQRRSPDAEEGSYYELQVEEPDLLLSCPPSVDPKDLRGWYQIDDTALFPSTHAHHAHDPTITAMTSGRRLFKPVHVRESASRSDDLRLRLPIGDADAAPFVQLVTVGSVLLAAAYVLAFTLRLTNRVERSEEKRERASFKSE